MSPYDIPAGSFCFCKLKYQGCLVKGTIPYTGFKKDVFSKYLPNLTTMKYCSCIVGGSGKSQYNDDACLFTLIRKHSKMKFAEGIDINTISQLTQLN